MKAFLRYLALCSLLSLFPAHAEKAQSLEEIRVQMIAALEKDIAENKDWNESKRGAATRTLRMANDFKVDAIDTNQLSMLGSYTGSGLFSAPTDALFKQFREQATLQINTLKEKRAAEFKDKVRGYLLRAFATTKPDEIVGIQKELAAYGEEVLKMDPPHERSSFAVKSSILNPKSILDNLAGFHAAKQSEDWNTMGSHLGYMDTAMKNLENYLSAKEVTDIMAKLRLDAGIVPPQEFEALYQKILGDLLDDANQDRIEEIRTSIQKYRSLSGSSSSGSSSPAQRWQRMDSFVSVLLQAVERAKDGGIPQISLESWTRNDSGYPPLMKKDKMVEALGKYRVKVRTDDGKVAEARLYYTMDELRDASMEILAEMLDDANQDRLDEIQQRIQVFQRFSSSLTEFYSVSQRFQQLGSFLQQLQQAVRRTQDGGVPRLNVDEWLRSGSEYGRLIEKKKLTEMLKRYRVKVPGADGKVREEPLYQEVDDIVARINTLDDVENELRVLTLISRATSYDSGQINLVQAVGALTALAELHANMKKGDSFVLPTQQSSGMYDGSFRSGQTDLLEESLLASKLEAFRNEAERAVLERMLAGEKIDRDGNRQEVMSGLLKKFIAAGNYQAVLTLGRVTAYFQPKQPLVSSYELQAIQNFLDGVRQQEELDEPRLATGHYQRAAAARSSIIPVEELRKRLTQIKQEHPVAYEKGTEDALSPERALAPYSQPPLVVPSR